MKINKKFCKSSNELMNLFADSLSAPEILTSKLMAQISSGITKERVKHCMNQENFAKYLGVTQSEVSRWESGDYNFSIKKIAEIAVKLNMDISINMIDMTIAKNNHNYSATFSSTKVVKYSMPNYSLSKTYSKEDTNYVTIR